MKRRIIWLVCTIALALGFLQSTLAFESFYGSRFAPGVFIGQHDVSGRTKNEARTLLSDFQSSFREKGMIVAFESKKISLLPLETPLDPDIPIESAQPLADIDIEQTIDTAFAIGHHPNWAASTGERLLGIVKKTVIPPVTIIDAQSLQAKLEKEFASVITAAIEPHFAYDAFRKTITITPGENGKTFAQDAIVDNVRTALAHFQLPVLSLRLEMRAPKHSESALRKLIDDAESLLSTSPTGFATDTGRALPLDQSVKAAWIQPTANGTSVSFDAEAVREYLSSEIEEEVRVIPEAPHFTLENGIVRALSGPVTGKSLDLDATTDAFISATSTDPVALAIRDAASPLAENAGAVQLKEIIATAQTDFRGSPTNRKKNIATGMARINGLLIMPDEEFSLLGALGPIELVNGFLPELVIKGNKTTPEAGGGLCQVSTTLFRAVAKAGIPVLERRNHSYRVSYYEPPVGFDATVYFPKPDFRFKNDTGSPILILASVSGTKANVTLWGTGDGRRTEIDEPTVFNIKKPGETRIVETTDLPPGKKKCTERAHNGADATFERRVAYKNGELKIDTFKSHYVVWPAVCLVGKKEDASDTATSSTPLIVNEQSNTSTPNQ